MVPYGMGQHVDFKKNFGPDLGDLDLDKFQNINDNDFTNNLSAVYKLVSNLKNNKILENKDLIGFVEPLGLY